MFYFASAILLKNLHLNLPKIPHPPCNINISGTPVQCGWSHPIGKEEPAVSRDAPHAAFPEGKYAAVCLRARLGLVPEMYAI